MLTAFCGMVFLLIAVLMMLISALTTEVCMLFSIVFWGSAGAFVVSIVVGAVGGMLTGDSSFFTDCVTVGAKILWIGGCALFFIGIAMVTIVLCRDFCDFLKLNVEPPVEWRHLIFAWERL